MFKSKCLIYITLLLSAAPLQTSIHERHKVLYKMGLLSAFHFDLIISKPRSGRRRKKKHSTPDLKKPRGGEIKKRRLNEREKIRRKKTKTPSSESEVCSFTSEGTDCK